MKTNSNLSNLLGNAKVRVFCGSVMALFLALLVVGLDGVWNKAQGLGNVQLFPTWVVFEGRTRSATVTLINSGDETATYRISFKNMRMTEAGGYEPVEEPVSGEKFAADYIRYSPRQVVLEPGKGQVIRLLLRKKKDMGDGEYRSHLYVHTVLPKDFGKSLEKPDRKKDEVSVNIVPIFGITIPVIVRKGNTSATVKLKDLVLHPLEKDRGRQKFSMTFSRQGNRSIYGDVSVTYQPSGGGKELEVARVNGIWVLDPNAIRKLSFDLTPPEGVALEKGKLRVAFKENSKEGGKTLAEGEISIP